MAGREVDQIEYWHDATETRESISSQHDFKYILGGAGWKKERPPAEMVRVPGLVHETSTLYMSDNLENDPNASVDSSYRPRKCDNV